jgi:ribose transport system ATP-binding protein
MASSEHAGPHRVEGMIASQPVSWNISSASGSDLFASSIGIWRHRLEADVSEDLIQRLSIKGAQSQIPCNRLSGGNQQKVVLARWLARPLKAIVLDNPTRGVDAGAKEEIYALLRSLAEQGVAILLITDELLELIGMSNRILIMQHGSITAEVNAPAHDKPTEQQLVEAMLSIPAPRTPAMEAA